MEWRKMNIRELEDFVKSNHVGISQIEIARKLGISKNTLIKSIRSESIKVTLFQDLCELLQTSPCYFFTERQQEWKKGILRKENDEDELKSISTGMLKDMMEQLKMKNEIIDLLKKQVENLMTINDRIMQSVVEKR